MKFPPYWLLVFFLCGCHRSIEGPEIILPLSGSTMGTRYHVKIAGCFEKGSAEPLQEEIEEELDRINNWMSTYRPDSEISRFNRFEGQEWFSVSSAFARVVKEALRVSRETDGAFDVTVGPLVNLWSFGPERRPKRVPERKAIEEVKSGVGYQHLEVRDEPAALKKLRKTIHVDLSAIAKGFGVDRIAGLLDGLGFENYLVEIGGEIRVRGAKPDDTPWKVGVETPADDKRRIEEVIELRDLSLATSGDYRNFFLEDGKRYSHTIDPRTGRPTEHRLASVTVVTEACMEADAWATALMVLGPEDGFAFASERNLAVLFLLREDEGFTRRATPAFETLVQQQGAR